MKTSHSSRATFKACKRKYHFSYIQELEQDRKPKALRMGSAWSDALEHGKQAIDEMYQPLLQTAPVWELGDLAHEMRILPALYDTYPFMLVNERREVPFIHKGAGFEDRGQLDGLIVGINSATIIENKLFARWGNQEIEKLEFDSQVTGYVAALVDGDIEGVPSIPLEGIEILYNVTMKPALRKKVNEYEKDFTSRCVADIYERPEHYHRQAKPTRTHDDLEDFRIRRNKFAMDLMYEEKMGVWERSPESCFDYGQCPFLKICRTPHIEGIPEGYRKKEERT